MPPPMVGSHIISQFSYFVNRIFQENSDPDRPYPCFTHLEALTKRDPDPEKFLPLFRDSILISREIGSGIVPMDPEERAWRERHGALVQKIAAQSKCVVRIFCGLEEVLK